MEQQHVDLPLQHAVNLFARLTPDGIARKLRKMRVQGRPHTVRDCPLARCFNAMKHGPFGVGKKRIYRDAGHGRIEYAKTPTNLRKFLEKFDVGGYPHLMAPPPRALPGKKRVRGPDRRPFHGGKRHKLKRAVARDLVALIGGR